MNHFEIVFTTVVVLTVLSAGSATAIVIAVDTRARPGARIVAVRLMKIAVLGAGAVIALLDRGGASSGIQ
ncbi:hypothetical protein KEU06_26165 [Pseudaminobacter sp. 19-2017]|uniref:Uncharacterized protein n=1 Tax=Pseudaminobacter soli (ex Zhang et al. 2022) TaxID=2831468 RepID=A0A942EBK4_9HYPH|nr:hypothetical protein [Pseudaminobacter soli]MBS3652092.1 hypothetical protein [Pseudaminobacter soli]